MRYCAPLRFSIVLLCLLALSGCVTLQDFENMSAEERATRVCDNRGDLQALRSNAHELEQTIAMANQALRRGYRVFSECEEYEVQTGTRTECKTLDYGVECEEQILWETRQRCSDTRVPINAVSERANIVVWEGELDVTRATLARDYQACFNYVLGLTAEEAFRLYR